jgi:aryl-alcohol dehydrogenase-like predicted oxidoreductase
VSKLPALAGEGSQDLGAVEAAIEQSLARLQRSSIDVYLTHRATDVTLPTVMASLRKAVDDGRVGQFGVSVYSPDEAKTAMRIEGLGALQIPVNVAMQDFIETGVLQEAAERGIALFARSIFLQGALLLAPDFLPAHLATLKPVNAALRSIAAEAGVSLPALLMGAVTSLPSIYSAVLGVDDRAQLEQLLSTSRGRMPSPSAIEAVFAAGRGLPRAVIDPRLWPASSL